MIMQTTGRASGEAATAEIAHDLRTPLTVIRGFSEILLDNPELPVSDRARFIAIVLAESERLQRRLERVLHRAGEGPGQAGCPEGADAYSEDSAVALT